MTAIKIEAKRERLAAASGAESNRPGTRQGTRARQTRKSRSMACKKSPGSSNRRPSRARHGGGDAENLGGDPAKPRRASSFLEQMHAGLARLYRTRPVAAGRAEPTTRLAPSKGARTKKDEPPPLVPPYPREPDCSGEPMLGSIPSATVPTAHRLDIGSARSSCCTARCCVYLHAIWPLGGMTAGVGRPPVTGGRGPGAVLHDPDFRPVWTRYLAFLTQHELGLPFSVAGGRRVPWRCTAGGGGVVVAVFVQTTN